MRASEWTLVNKQGAAVAVHHSPKNKKIRRNHLHPHIDSCSFSHRRKGPGNFRPKSSKGQESLESLPKRRTGENVWARREQRETY